MKSSKEQIYYYLLSALLHSNKWNVDGAEAEASVIFEG